MLDQTTTGDDVTTAQRAPSAVDPSEQEGPPLLEFGLVRNGTTETLFVRGELDISSAPSFEHAVADALDGQGGVFRVDLGGLTFMDSTGAGSLLRVHARVEGIGRDLVLVHPTRSVRRVLELLGLDRVIRVEH